MLKITLTQHNAHFPFAAFIFPPIRSPKTNPSRSSLPLFPDLHQHTCFGLGFGKTAFVAPVEKNISPIYVDQGSW